MRRSILRLLVARQRAMAESEAVSQLGMGYISGKNIELEPGKRIVQEWVTSEWPEDFPPSRLELTFKKVKGGTEISMVHSDVPSEQAAELKEGWTKFYWKLLKDYFRSSRKEG